MIDLTRQEEWAKKLYALVIALELQECPDTGIIAEMCEHFIIVPMKEIDTLILVDDEIPRNPNRMYGE
jgi:hypothetical protein